MAPCSPIYIHMAPVLYVVYIHMTFMFYNLCSYGTLFFSLQYIHMAPCSTVFIHMTTGAFLRAVKRFRRHTDDRRRSIVE